MDVKAVRELAKIMTDHKLQSLEITEGETTIRLEKCISVQTGTCAAVDAPHHLPASPEKAAEEKTVDFNNVREIKAPMVGVFYTAPGPDQPPFVRVGSRVEKGDVLCVIEAMKLMNEVLAEESGEIIDICAANGDIVEFSQTLFKIC